MMPLRRSGDLRHPDQRICTWPSRCATCEDRDQCPIMALAEENEILKEEIRLSRESAEITANLVVKQFEETERILRRFQVANAQRKAVLDSATHMAIIATDQDGTIAVFNKGAERMLGYSATEVVGRLTPLPFHDRRELADRVASLSAEIGRPFEQLDLFFHYALHLADQNREWTYVRRDGASFPVNLSISPLRDAEGRLSGFLCIAEDMTERKLAEAALHQSEEKYRSLFDSGPNPIFVLDGDSLQILDMNPAAIEMYGYSKSDLIGRPFNELGEFEIRRPGLPGDRASDWVQECFINQKVRHYRKDGTIFYLRLNACPINYGDHHAIILAATDITEAMEKDAQLFQATKMKTLGEMSAGMAHELTQPLNAIKIGNDFLQRMIRAGKTIRTEDLDRVALSVTDQVKRASDIIHRLREFGRSPDFKKEPVDLNSVVRNVMQIVGQQLALNNIEVVYQLGADLPTILANANRLEQVLFNLVSNARDAIHQQSDGDPGPTEKTITLRTCVEKGFVVCSVADTGGGIAGNARDKIFEPFFTTKEVGKGMGLGLAISYGIVQDYNGTIEVSQLPSGGTCFSLHFPCP